MMARSSTSGQGRKPGVPNKITRPIRELAGTFTEGAIRTLVQIMIDPMAPHASKIAAAKELLDRAHGRPSASAEIKSKRGESLAEMGERIISAATNGSLPLDHASQLMGALQAQAKLHETTELIQRLESLEALIQRKQL
jgi:hypothetical protein